MLSTIYNARKEFLDDVIKNSIKNLQEKVNTIESLDTESNREFINKIEEIYNMKLAQIVQDVYIQGVKDGTALLLELSENSN